MTSRTAPVLLGLLLALVPACRKRAPAAAPAAAVDAGEPARGGDVQPVYAKTTGPTDARAVRMCRILHGLPAERRAACCAGTRSIVAERILKECERSLGSAVASGSVTLDTAALDACEAELQRSLSGCDWVGPWPPPAPARCAEALRGQVKAGAPCRSSLECQGALRCEGAGPTEAGRCGPPGEVGVACRMSVDPLAGFVRDDRVDQTHPECRGWCERHRCVPYLQDACTGPAQCGPGRHCADRRCVDGATAASGGACTGGACPGDERCWQGKCIRPRADGACSSDFDCQGACVKAPGATTGRCAMDCSRS